MKTIFIIFLVYALVSCTNKTESQGNMDTRVNEKPLPVQNITTLLQEERQVIFDDFLEEYVGNIIEESILPDDFEWQQDEQGGVIITGYTGLGGVVAIPPEIHGMAVVAIGESAFAHEMWFEEEIFRENFNLTSITIPDGVTSIGKNAFRTQSLQSINIPDSVMFIGEGAFAENQLTSVTMPRGITSIERESFSDNDLRSIDIPDTVIFIGGSAFAHNSLFSLSIPDSVTSIGDSAFFGNRWLENVSIPPGVTSIGRGAFYDNQLSNITIPNGVTVIECSVFFGNRLKSFTIPASVVSVVGTAFSGNNELEAIYVDPDNLNFISIDGVLYDKSGTTLLRWPPGKKPVSIPDGVTAIEDYAFVAMGLTEIIIPGSVTAIGRFAFWGNRLTSLTLPDSLTSIGEEAFSMNGIPSITIPVSVTYIGRGAFLSTFPQSVTIGANVPVGGAPHGPIAFGGDFDDAYRNAGRLAGTYTRSSDGRWTRE